MKNSFISCSEEETKKIAQIFISTINTGQVVGLKGDLGSGKTFFVKTVAELLGYSGIVKSPTFILRHDYAVHYNVFKKIIHIDLYRLETVSEKETFLEDIRKEDTLTFIEWSERLRNKYFLDQEISFQILSEKKRKIRY